MSTIDALTDEPTPASAWQAVSGTNARRRATRLAPDLFPLTDVILECSEA
jgi:hypothetical protein